MKAAGWEPALGVYLDFADAIRRLGENSAFGNATAICSKCMSGSRTKILTRFPMRIYPAIHYTMGGLWVDYQPDEHHPGSVRRSAKRTFPIMEPIGWARAR